METYEIETVNTKLQKHNYKLTEDDQKEIILNYLFNKHSMRDILTRYNISKQTYYNVINKHKKDNYSIIEKELEEVRNNFTKKTSLLIDKALNKIEEQLDNGDINISQLGTTLGILYDKERLEQGKATSNNAFSINIKIDK